MRFYLDLEPISVGTDNHRFHRFHSAAKPQAKAEAKAKEEKQRLKKF